MIARTAEKSERDNKVTMFDSIDESPDTKYSMAIKAVSAGKLDNAMPLFRSAIAGNPRKTEFWLSYIDALITAKRPEGALAVLNQAKGIGLANDAFDRLNILLLKTLEEKHNETGNNARRLGSIDHSLPKTIDTFNLQTALRLANKKYKAGAINDAKLIYEDVLKIYPQNKIALEGHKSMIASEPQKLLKDQFRALIKLVTQREFDKALTLGTELDRKSPDSPDLQNILGVLNAELGSFEKAISYYQKAVRIKPNFAEAHNNMGVALKTTGQIELAVESYEKAIAAKPEYAGAYNNLGNILAGTGDVQAAGDKYKQALAIDPNSASAHNNLGLMLSALDDHKSAILSFRNAIHLKPEFFEAHNNLGISLTKVGDVTESINSYEKAVEIDPKFASAYDSIGRLRKRTGDSDNAIKSFEKAIKINPSYAEAHYNLGNTLRERNNFNDAVECYKTAISLNSSYLEAHCNLGVALGELGKLTEAAVCYKKAIIIKPKHAIAHSQLGGILNRLGNLDEAESSYRQALSIQPTHPDANYNFGLMLLENGKFGEAAKHFKLCGNSNSESYMLRCFYLEDKMTEFYEQLDKLIDKKVCNAMVGSFSSRAKLRYGIETPNPFCVDPLKYVAKIDLNRVCDFERTFVASCKSILNDENTPYRNQNLIVNGKQTAGNLLALNSESLREIEKVIRSEVYNYRCEFLDSNEGMFINWPTDYSINCWLVSMKSGGELAAHIHEIGWISGSIYINVPAKSRIDSGNLVVCLNSEKFQSGEAGGENIDVFTGALCLFPSSLLHYTVPFESEEERIVLAFDVVPQTLDG